ncbi:Hypothetical_protein [Hexamita inflata]|uniref:Hypothetical_protein n=1 Tax=Hexamita inflata TaxID=28002 RepID=A0AA86QJT2_9EUKA|nr:Hypothetical protein HINF_LOCUS45342 [Hexamita inflata]
MIYLDYDSCYRNCYKGICELTYDNVTNIIEYTCKSKSYNYNLFWWFMVIPLLIPIIITLAFCCCGKKEDTVEIVEIKTKPETVLVPAQQTNQNVTAVQVQGQQVTLPNGQVGIFVQQPLQNDTIQMPIMM